MTGDVELVTGEILAAGPSSDLTFAYSSDQAKKWMTSLQEYRRAILEQGPDYMVIPGTTRPSLLKPGAEKLLLAAGLGFTILKVDDDDSRAHQGVTYRCTVRRGGQIVAECDGYAGYDESRFYISQADNEAKEKAWAEKDKRRPRPDKMLEYKASWNSVSKMAQKRAMVGATLNALAASGLFTQDLEDDVPPPESPPPKPPTPDELARQFGWQHNDHLKIGKQQARDLLASASDEDRSRLWSEYQHPDGPGTPRTIRTVDEHAEWIEAHTRPSEPPSDPYEQYKEEPV